MMINSGALGAENLNQEWMEIRPVGKISSLISGALFVRGSNLSFLYESSMWTPFSSVTLYKLPRSTGFASEFITRNKDIPGELIEQAKWMILIRRTDLDRNKMEKSAAVSSVTTKGDCSKTVKACKFRFIRWLTLCVCWVSHKGFWPTWNWK